MGMERGMARINMHGRHLAVMYGSGQGLGVYNVSRLAHCSTHYRRLYVFARPSLGKSSSTTNVFVFYASVFRQVCIEDLILLPLRVSGRSRMPAVSLCKLTSTYCRER